jgi:hypothetical protein
LRARLVVVLIVLLAAARAQAQPAPLHLLDVPYVSQSEALCGGAAAAMVLRYWGQRGITAGSFAALVDRSAAGIRTTALVDDLRRRGWMVTPATGTTALVGRELAAGRPVLALIEDHPHVFHYIVIVAATADAVVFHDPARAPLRVMASTEFDRRWRATDRWVALIVPGAATEQPPDRAAGEAAARGAGPDAGSRADGVAAGGACEQRVQSGIEEAQRNDLEAAERSLVEALSCPGAAARRELAGVRFLQQRWDDAAALAAQAVALDPSDAYSWRLLGNTRFLGDQPRAALAAWNHAGEPKLDLLRVDGLEHTRQRPVEQLIGLSAGALITPDVFMRSERALRELPSARSTRLGLAPPAQGIADLRAVVDERPRLPHDRWTFATVAANAVIARTAGLTLGSLTGGGESIALEWRFWTQRPRIAGSFRAPAPWSGTWGVDAYGESQEFDDGVVASRRRGGRVVAARWLTSHARVEWRGGGDRWQGPARAAFGSAGITLLVTTTDDRLMARTVVDGFAGASRFGTGAFTVAATSARRATEPPLVSTFTATVAGVSRQAPLDVWPAGDTGQARPLLLRAHPVLDDGRLRVDRIGRTLVQASGELQRWWNAPALSRIGAAVFVDVARTANRMTQPGALDDVDLGFGVRLASGLTAGRVYLDVAHGLRDGSDAFSARYVTAAW